MKLDPEMPALFAWTAPVTPAGADMERAIALTFSLTVRVFSSGRIEMHRSLIPEGRKENSAGR
jgi:hypothetical protein